MTKLESCMALERERERERERGTLLNNGFFARRILLSMLKINIDSKGKTGIDCITVNVSKRNIYGDVVYPFCACKRIKQEYKNR